MTEKISLIDVTEEEVQGTPLLETLRNVLLASVGAVAVAQEEVEALIRTLVERGELADKDARALMDDLRERRSHKLDEARAAQERRLDAVLKRVNIPTRSDIETLKQRVAELSQQIDALIEASSEEK